MKRRNRVLLTVTLILSGCSSDAITTSTETTSTSADPSATVLEVSDLLEGESRTSARVRGLVFWDEDAAQLCAVLMESFPPQCGGPSIRIGNPELLAVEFTETQGIRWTDSVVEISGTWDGSLFLIDSEVR